MKHQVLVSLPPAAASIGSGGLSAVAFVGGDPPGRQLGSGGGTAHLLCQAWKALARGSSFSQWLAGSPKLVIHASGQSRRLPSYAAEGKLRLPMPLIDGRAGQTPDQTLLDAQLSDFAHLLRHAPNSYRLAVACGDTLVRQPGFVPPFPEADVLIVGIPSSPEEACAHGVLFSNPSAGGQIEFFLQKPSPETIVRLAATHPFSLDSGVWLFSERAVQVLLSKCGWDERGGSFPGGVPKPYDLFDRFGTALGRNPTNPDPDVATLSSAVLPLPEGRFYHFGSNRSVFHSVSQLVEPAENRRSFGDASRAADSGGDRFVLHSDAPGVPASARPLWIENSTVPQSWTLSGEHVITGVPPNNWTVSLPRGVCVDAVPFPGGGEALRVYGFADTFKGSLGDKSTAFLGAPFQDWLAARGLSLESAGLARDCDIQDAPLFPVLDWSDGSNAAILQWMANAPSAPDPDLPAAVAWLAARRVSATDLVQRADLAPRIARRAAFVEAEIASRSPERRLSDCLICDLAVAAAQARQTGGQTAETGDAANTVKTPGISPLAPVHEAMFKEVATGRAPSPDAFGRLRELLVGDLSLSPVSPSRNVLDNQIVWGRAPARLDLAGGWSDTPPYCLEHGGRVVNVAVDLNGQPPIQAFVSVCQEPCIRLHSIDLGLSETISTYDELCAPSALGPFSIPRAAMRLAGFDPRFARGAAPTLREQLQRTMGGGLELSMLAAIPKGSGLGTSSILAATILGVLGDICALGWTAQDLFDRTTVLEQLLTSGGGWQDQLGGVLPGAKFAVTRPGLHQAPDVRYLPDGMLSDLVLSGRALLYYTGVTRVARSILGDIVRGIFLNDRRVLSCIEDIACNADFAANAIQRADEAGLCEALRRSWSLNCELDSGTCPDALLPAVSAMRRRGAAHKLLGAGGGGYLFAIAPDAASAAEIREELTRNPPNPGARFVSISLSRGLQITRS